MKQEASPLVGEVVHKTMKPNLEELEQYSSFLRKKNLFDAVQNYVVEEGKNSAIKSISFSGDYEYNDEGGNDFYLYDIRVEFDDGFIDYDWNNAELLFDQCSFNTANLINDYNCSLKIEPNDLSEPFQLVKL